MSSGEDSVHTATAGENSSIGSGATKIGDDNKLISNSSLRPGVVSQGSGNRLVDDLQDLKTSSVGRGNQSLTLGIGEVGRHSDNSSVDILAQVVRSGLLQTTEMAGRNLGDGDSVSGLIRTVNNGEGNSRLVGLGVRRVVAWCGVYRFEAVAFMSARFIVSHGRNHPCQENILLAKVISEVCDSVLGVADKLSLGLSAMVFLAIYVGEDGRNLTI
jgi:hypothetical protein